MAHARAEPNRLAVVADDGELSYAELEQRTKDLAGLLQERGCRRGARAAVFLDRSCELIVALLGIIRAGAAYVPLDPAYPPERISLLLNDSGADLIVSDDSVAPKLPVTQAAIVPVNAEPSLRGSTAPQPTAGHLAYVMYTSGSTGQPKGVMVSHAALAASTAARLGYYPQPVPRSLLLSSVAFDSSVATIFGTLCRGGTLVLGPPGLERRPEEVAERIAAHRISHILCLPSLYAMVLATAEPRQLESLRTVMVAGEVCQPDLPGRHRDALSGVPLFNEYGPTEGTVWATVHRIDSHADAPVPIGTPIPTARVYLLDRELRPVPAGARGEIYLAGSGVARGYLGRPALTAAHFLPDPFGGEPGARMYRTGDLARARADGTIEFLGRADDQVKIRGHRVELGEVEAALRRHDGVADAAVAAHGAPGDERLVAYMVPRADVALGVDELRQVVGRSLPGHMTPASFVALAQLPRTPSGKLDRRRLGEPDAAGRSLADEPSGDPRTPSEETLADIWADVLGLERVGVHDNFFSLGGDSIQGMQVVLRATAAGLRVRTGDLFEHQTIAELAAAASKASPAEAAEEPSTGPVPLTPAQRWFFERELDDPHHWNQTALLHVDDDLDSADLSRAVTSLIEQHDLLRARFMHGDGGWQQRVMPVAEAPAGVTQIDLSVLPRDTAVSALEACAAELQASLDLERGPVARFVLFDLGSPLGKRLLIVIHHLVVDAVSWQILLDELRHGLHGSQGRGAERARRPKTASVRRWIEHLREHARSQELRREADYWRAQVAHPVPGVPRDWRAGGNLEGDAATVSYTLDRDRTRTLVQRLPRELKVDVAEAVLAAVARAICDWTGGRQVLVDVEAHGRERLFEDLDLSHTVGWLTAIFPLRLSLPADRGIDDAVRLVKEQLRAVPHHGIGWGVLRYLSDEAVPDEIARFDGADVIVNYLGQLDSTLDRHGMVSLARERNGPVRAPSARRTHLLEVNALVLDGRLEVEWRFGKQVHRRSTIERLVRGFSAELEALSDRSRVASGGLTPSDFPLARLDQSRLQRVAGTDPANVEDIYPLSPAQHGILFHMLYAPDAGLYAPQLSFTLRGTLDVAAFESAWQHVVDHHPTLRTDFVVDDGGEPLQVVRRTVSVSIEREDWRALAPNQRSARLQSRLRQEARQGFDPTAAPLMRLQLIQLEDDAYRFVWSFHHALLDGWSTPVLLRDVFAAYDPLRRGQAVSLAEPFAYRDYIAWLREHDLAEAERHWRDVLAGFRAATPLFPAHRAPGGPGAGDHDDADRETAVSAALTTRLQDFARHHGLTLNTLLQAAWATLLARHAGEPDVVFGAVVSGRTAGLPGIDRGVGLFINTLPVRVSVTADRPLLGWLEDIQRQQGASSRFEHTPLARLQQWTEVKAGEPLFNSILVFENYPIPTSSSEEPDGVAIEDPSSEVRTSYPLTLVAVQGDSLALRLRYDGRQFDAATIDLFLEQLVATLEAMATVGDDATVGLVVRPIDRIGELVPDPGAPLAAPHHTTVPEQLLRQAGAAPDAPAVRQDGKDISYAELVDAASRAAAALSAQGLQPGDAVAVLGGRSPGLVVAMAAALWSGGVLVPIDPELPAKRRRSLARAARVTHALVVGERSDGDLADTPTVVLTADRGLPVGPDGPQPTAQPAPLSGQSPAYIFFTSGTSDSPAAVLGSHQGLAHFLDWERSTFEVAPGDRCGQLTALSFDVVLRDVFLPLVSGATLCLPPAKADLGADRVLPWLEHERISILHTVPALAESWLAAGTAVSLRHLRLVMFAGEPLTDALVRRWRAAFPDAGRIVNAYGPTETTLAKCWYLVPDHPPPGVQPIGSPLPGTQALIMAEDNRQCDIGEVGEIVIRTPFRSLGYRDPTSRDASRFYPNPFRDDPHDVLYKTGDLGRRQPDGLLEILGRRDDEIKLRGVRISPSEVGAVLARHPGVAACTVVAVTQPRGDRALAAYVVAAPGGKPPSATDLRSHAASELPPPMIPSHIVFLDRLPLTTNGKVDRRALPPCPAPTAHRDGEARPSTPSTPTERGLAEMWHELLGVDVVSLDDDFFLLGGHSLVATQLVARVRQRFGAELPLAIVFQEPTLAGLARAIDTAERVPAADAIARLPRRPLRGSPPDATVAPLERTRR